jgi:hypothetical protein
MKQKINDKYKKVNKHLTLTSETKIGDRVIVDNEFHCTVEIDEEIFEDLNNIIFKKNPDKLYKIKFEECTEPIFTPRSTNEP